MRRVMVKLNLRKKRRRRRKWFLSTTSKERWCCRSFTQLKMEFLTQQLIHHQSWDRYKTEVIWKKISPSAYSISYLLMFFYHVGHLNESLLSKKMWFFFSRCFACMIQFSDNAFLNNLLLKHCDGKKNNAAWKYDFTHHLKETFIFNRLSDPYNIKIYLYKIKK